MLITNTKFKDYYDGVAGTTGIDKTIIYNRYEDDLKLSDIEKQFPDLFKTGWKSDSSFMKLVHHTNLKKNIKFQKIGCFIVGFCGKYYVGWKLYYEINNELMTEITYDINSIKVIINEDSYYGKFIDFYNYVISYKKIEFFRKFNIPIFVLDGDFERTSIKSRSISNNTKLIINPCLKKYEFYKVFDTFQTFQEIQMFIGGVLGSNENNIIEIEDRYKISQHGFDKWSFRKESPNKK